MSQSFKNLFSFVFDTKMKLRACHKCQLLITNQMTAMNRYSIHFLHNSNSNVSSSHGFKYFLNIILYFKYLKILVVFSLCLADYVELKIFPNNPVAPGLHTDLFQL